MTLPEDLDLVIGDPDGRRVAAQEASYLGEASRVAETLIDLLGRTNVDPSEAKHLAASIASLEQSALQRAYGRIEPRRRFKVSSGHPLHDSRKRNLLFIDESGKANAGNEPFFALGAVAMSKKAAKRYRRAADAIKQEFFGTTQITFHEPDMQRHQTVFRLESDPAKQADFCSQVTQLVKETEFVAFGAVIRREAFSEFQKGGTDPYLPWDVYAVAIHLLMERYIDYLSAFGKRSLGRVTFESQGPVEDAQHQAVFADLLLSGTQWVPDKAFRNWMETSARFVPKSGSHGTEIADMLSRCLYEWVRDGCNDETRSERWDVFCSKVHSRGDRRMGKFGIKVFPDSDIRGLIEDHRAASGRV